MFAARMLPFFKPCRGWRITLALLLGAGLDARAQWTLESTATASSPEPGITHTVQTVREASGGGRATLHFVGFEERAHNLRVIDQGPTGRASLAESMQQHGCLAGINGGYFHPDFEPVGLLVSDGRVIRGPQRAKLLSGALVVTENHLKLLRSTDPLPGQNARQALQSGPYLVDGAKPVAGLNNGRSARRTAILTSGKGGWALASTSALTLAELGAILAQPALLPGGMKVERALNLDGGSSTAMWVRQPGGAPFSIGEFGIVRDFVGIVPRNRPAVGKKGQVPDKAGF